MALWRFIAFPLNTGPLRPAPPQAQLGRPDDAAMGVAPGRLLSGQDQLLPQVERGTGARASIRPTRCGPAAQPDRIWPDVREGAFQRLLEKGGATCNGLVRHRQREAVRLGSAWNRGDGRFMSLHVPNQDRPLLD